MYMKSFLFPSFPLSRKRFYRINFYESQEVTALSSVPWSTLNPKDSCSFLCQSQEWHQKVSLSSGGLPGSPPAEDPIRVTSHACLLASRVAAWLWRDRLISKEHDNKTHLQKTMSIFFNEVISPHGCLPNKSQALKVVQCVWVGNSVSSFNHR